jgi:hypothetical protein
MAWRRRSAARPELLGFLILGALVLLIACSPVGNLRSDQTRYFLPAALAAPLLLARLCERIGARSRAAALLCAAALIVFNVTGVPLRGEYRREKTELAASEDRLIRLLEQRGTALVLGQYWHVSPLNLLSRERVRAVSPGLDVNGSLDSFGASPVSLALVSRRPGEVAAWSAAAGLTGRIERIGTFDVFFPVPDPPTREPPAALAQRLLAELPAH